MLFNVLSESAAVVDVLKPIAFYVTIGILSALVIASFVVFFVRREFFKKFLNAAIFSFFVYALAFGVVLLVFDVIKHYDAAYLDENYVSRDVVFYILLPALFTVFFTLVTVVLAFWKSKKDVKSLKIALIVSVVVTVLSLVVLLVLIGVYHNGKISGDGYYTGEGSGFDQTALYVSAGLLVVGAVVSAFLFDKRKADFNAKIIARAGICVALSFVLSYAALFKMPQGGTVTLASLLPLMLFAYSYGLKRGLIVGLIFGLFQSLQDPFIIHPAQYMLDYPIAFSMIGFAGVVSGLKLPAQFKFALGAIIAGTLRFVAHVLSGVFAFGAYAGGENILIYSLAYNSFVFVDVAITIAAGILLLFNRAFRQLVEAE